METLQPKLRFPDYSMNFKENKISELTTYVDYRGKTPQKSENGVFLVTAKNIKMGFIDYESSKEYVTIESYEEVMRRGKPLIGDVLITTEAPLGNVASIDNIDIALAQRVIKYRGEKNILDNSYLKYFFLSEYFQNVLLEKATGGTVKGIKGSVLHRLTIKYPSFQEQTKIASFLTAIDAKTKQLTQKKSLLEEYKKGIMQKIFSQELRFKDDNGKDFEDWEEKKLGEIGQIVSGLTYSPNDIDENGILVLRSSNVQNRRLVYNDNVFVNAKTFNPVIENDILICVRNGSKNLIGKNALIDNDSVGFAFGAFMTVYRSDFNRYLIHWFDTNDYKKIVETNLGATINSINGSDLKKFIVPFPSLKEQTKIANFLSAIDDKINQVSTQLEQTTQYKKGLLQKMFV